MHNFEFSDRSVSRFHRFESECGLDQTFELVVVGLDYIVAIFDLSMLHSARKLALAFERRDHLSISGSFKCRSRRHASFLAIRSGARPSTDNFRLLEPSVAPCGRPLCGREELHVPSSFLPVRDS